MPYRTLDVPVTVAPLETLTSELLKLAQSSLAHVLTRLEAVLLSDRRGTELVSRWRRAAYSGDSTSAQDFVRAAIPPTLLQYWVEQHNLDCGLFQVPEAQKTTLAEFAQFVAIFDLNCGRLKCDLSVLYARGAQALPLARVIFMRKHTRVCGARPGSASAKRAQEKLDDPEAAFKSARNSWYDRSADGIFCYDDDKWSAARCVR